MDIVGASAGTMALRSPNSVSLAAKNTNHMLPSDRFNSAWRAVSEVRECSVSDVDAFIQAHYLGKRPAIVTLALKMFVRSAPVGAVVYAMPPPETAKRYGGLTWELARLYLLDEIPRNAETWLIAQSVRCIKRHFKAVQYLVSYADPAAGHTGTIYRAANWKQDGSTDDERKTPRSDYVDTVSGKKYGRAGNVPAHSSIERRPRIAKFWFVLKIQDRPACERIENAQRQARMFA